VRFVVHKVALGQVFLPCRYHSTSAPQHCSHTAWETVKKQRSFQYLEACADRNFHIRAEGAVHPGCSRPGAALFPKHLMTPKRRT